MPIALADLLDEEQVILKLRSRKPANAIREIVDMLGSENGQRKIETGAAGAAILFSSFGYKRVLFLSEE